MKEDKSYKFTVEETFEKLNTNINGLDVTEAENRHVEFGPNKLAEGKKKTLLSRFIDQMKNVMIIILLIAAIVSFIVAKIENESYTDSIVIFAVVIMNAVLGVAQEAKADKAIESLKKMSLPYIKVRRSGKIESIKTEELVVGDIVLIEAGDFVPADMRIIECNSIKVEEASLTGESLPVSKFTDVITEDTALADRRNMLYSGSSVVYGRGEGIVTAIGMDTELGKIATMLTDTKESLTPLQKKINEISKVLSVVVVVIGLAMVVLGILQGNKLLEIFMLSVSLAVAAIPEGLPASITIILSIGVQKMAKKHSIIRKLASVETLGATEIICSDKTGTLTQNKMTVTEVNLGGNRIVTEDLKYDISNEALDVFIKNMMLCNDVKINAAGDGFLGDPTEIALVQLGVKLGLDKEVVDTRYKRMAELPFDSERKLMTTVNSEDGKLVVNVKGAIEGLIERCTKAIIGGKLVELTDDVKRQILEANQEMSSRALRVLGFAYKQIDDVPEDVATETLENDLIYVGLVGMIDPPRPEVKQAVKDCYSAGMIPIMITGDSISTAVAIAKDIGILTEGKEAITGQELDAMSDEEFEKRIKNIRVYARVSPENKVRIVKVWKKLGKTVAMTGDGVNDAPALKNADIGVGMGITGTEVSKSVASMVLTDDNFASIVVAVKEGRRVYKNIQNVIAYLLASNIAEVLIVFIAKIFNSTVFSPLHLLWINLITDAIPAMTLGFEPADKNSMKEKPRRASEKFFNPFLITRIVVPAVIKSIMVLVLYFFVESNPLYNHAHAMTVAFITLSFAELLFAFVIRSDRKSILKTGIFTNPQLLIGVTAILVIQLCVIFIPAISSIFELVHLDNTLYLISIGAALAYMIVAEIAKLVIAKVFKVK
ncbi:MAG: cation-translocating P-type ATPase [Clostridia bacterium]|nr:cation-translocating P-type ATPase [Clostridia bacterium]